MTRTEFYGAVKMIDDQQPIARTVGRRMAQPLGELPNAEARAAWNALSKDRVTGAPKGVFIYTSHEEMTRDRERWTLDAIAKQQHRTDPA